MNLRAVQINGKWWRFGYRREPQGRSDYPMVTCVFQLGPFLWLWSDFKTKKEEKRQRAEERGGRYDL